MDRLNGKMSLLCRYMAKYIHLAAGCLFCSNDSSIRICFVLLCAHLWNHLDFFALFIIITVVAIVVVVVVDVDVDVATIRWWCCCYLFDVATFLSVPFFPLGFVEFRLLSTSMAIDIRWRKTVAMLFISYSVVTVGILDFPQYNSIVLVTNTNEPITISRPSDQSTSSVSLCVRNYLNSLDLIRYTHHHYAIVSVNQNMDCYCFKLCQYMDGQVCEANWKTKGTHTMLAYFLFTLINPAFGLTISL